LLSQDALGKTVIPILQNLYKDPVPNVRMNAAKALKTVNPYLKEKSPEVIYHFDRLTKEDL
jgi:hypothetical protein